ncbi:MAG: phosphoglycerate kinase [Candidatus Omnitrophica bacterium]|nr:phosphoglycerate kinase [Candidatus Omnitrophota bacterium]
MNKLTLKDVSLENKNVLMRVDFNVPLDEKLEVSDDTRIKATLPTIRYILDKKPNKLILISHLGRPEGKKDPKYSLRPVAKRLSELLAQQVRFIDDCIGKRVKEEIKETKEKVILLENLRFYPEEEKNDSNFSKELASLGDIFVNDAFGTAHRAHASTEGLTHYLTSVAGLLLEKEIQYLGDLLQNPNRPFVVILGGSKVSDKIGVINNLLPKADSLLIAGAMAYTFLYAQGKSIGNSKLEKDKVLVAKEILEKAKSLNKDIVLPIDHIVVDNIDANASLEVAGEDIPSGKIAVDIGPQTIEEFKKRLKDAKTVVWNGPLGIFEIDKFSQGTYKVASFIASLSCISIVGGGDTASSIAKFGLESKFSHISTGGGASLEFMEGKLLPGIKALTDKNE